ncbi:DUF881 domain-containing protein [Ruminiclostridium herbifermentans]|uniref:DUF881 domain-containing protein n=1 Tax=Ruminiclostridium herbifermentans TaxID=2488810 RepID=A0A4U7JD47_9FIRM|nr:DUF881 domain-containing protein [Ruminiclostridium herbifermentans]QNU65671.1 DUF881 domain-containing protein [Ruminiclostridium herbifermentans]
MKLKGFRVNDRYIILLFAFMLLGALITLQIRSTVSVQRQAADILNTDKLKIQLDEKIKTGEKYKEQIEKLENDKAAFLAAPINNVSISQKKELEYLKLISGLTDVTGEGVIITLNDAEFPDSEIVMDYIIHDNDIYNVVNQLKIAGALAISINDERIIATSELICAGPTIKINNNRYAVPYTIKAIGDSDVLYKALKESYIINDMLTLKKRVTISQEKDIVVPKFTNDINSLISRLEVIDYEDKKN